MPLRKACLRPPACPAGPFEAGLVQKAIRRYNTFSISAALVAACQLRSCNAESKTPSLACAQEQAACPRFPYALVLGRMPELPREKAAPQCVSPLRLLQGSGSD